MFIQLIDKNGDKSPFLYIHHDYKEFLNEIEKWRQDLIQWRKNNPLDDGTPLGRGDVSTCIVDLLRHLTEYYVKTDAHNKGRITNTLCLYSTEDIDKEDENITIIKTYG